MSGDRSHRWMFALGLGLLAVLYAQFAARPALEDLAERRARLVATRAEIARGDNFTRGLEDLARYLDEFATALSELDRLVPKAADSDVRLRDVNAIGQRLGLAVTKIRPDPPTPRGEITAHPLTIHVRGTYPQLENFLYEVESLARLSRVTRCEVSRADASNLDASIDAEVELTSFSVSAADGGGGS